MSVLEDRELVARILAGDGAAFEEMVERYGPMLRGICVPLVKSQAHADDVMQETWLAVLQALAGFEYRSSLRSWLCSIALNRGRSRWRREARDIPLSAIGDESAVLDGLAFTADGRWALELTPRQTMADPEAWSANRELAAIALHAVDQLPELQRLVVQMRDVHGLTAEEVCNALGIAETHQRVLLHRGRLAVRKTLLEHIKA